MLECRNEQGYVAIVAETESFTTSTVAIDKRNFHLSVYSLPHLSHCSISEQERPSFAALHHQSPLPLIQADTKGDVHLQLWMGVC